GIHKKRDLPAFHRETFSAWFDRRKPAAFEPQARVALFATCSVDFNDPATGKAAVAVLERNRVEVSLPAQRCCGMPYLDGGAVKEAKALIRDNVEALAESVRQGRDIVVPGPTCSYMIKQLHPWLDGSEDASHVPRHNRDLLPHLSGPNVAGKLLPQFPPP